MLKRIAVILLVLTGISLHAQTQSERIKISGKINVSLDGDASNINVFNMTSGEYTFSDKYGRFSISVKLDDELVFSGIQYQQFTLIITQGVLNNRALNINLTEGITRLDEVVVRPDLYGDVNVDIRKLKTERANLPSIIAEDAITGYDYRFAADRYSPVDNDAVGRGYNKGYLQNGINFVNIFKSVFHTRNKNSHSRKTADMDVEVRKLYNDEFFKQYLGIKEESINDFIFFMEDRGMTLEILSSKNDLELIDYLIEQSEAYKEN